MTWNRANFAGAILALMVTVAGCALHRDPSIVVLSAAPGAATNDAMVVNVTLDLANPNSDEALRLQDFKYDLKINGKSAYQGVRAAQATLASSDQRQIVLPAVVRFADFGWTPQTAPAAADFTIDGSLSYFAPGELARVLLDMGFPLPAANFEGTGQVSLRAAQAAPSGVAPSSTAPGSASPGNAATQSE